MRKTMHPCWSWFCIINPTPSAAWVPTFNIERDRVRNLKFTRNLKFATSKTLVNFMKKMMFLSKNWYFSVQKALIYYTVDKSHHNSFILLVFSHVANFRYVANFRFLTLVRNKIFVTVCKIYKWWSNILYAWFLIICRLFVHYSTLWKFTKILFLAAILSFFFCFVFFKNLKSQNLRNHNRLWLNFEPVGLYESTLPRVQITCIFGGHIGFITKNKKFKFLEIDLDKKLQLIMIK